MKRFDIVTLFPEVVEPYLNASILKRAQEKKLARMKAHDLRKWTSDKHRTVDDAPYGGGPGMVMKVEPVFRAVKSLYPRPSTLDPHRVRVLLTSAAGRPFDQRRAKYYAGRYEHIIIICGRYEGVDHRVAKHVADEEVSVGPYVLTGGELPALTIIDAVTRLIPGVIKPESLEEESFSFNDVDALRLASRAQDNQSSDRTKSVGKIGEYPQYTRPEIFYPEPKPRAGGKRKAWRVPGVLLGGNHAEIEQWRLDNRK